MKCRRHLCNLYIEKNTKTESGMTVIQCQVNTDTPPNARDAVMNPHPLTVALEGLSTGGSPAAITSRPVLAEESRSRFDDIPMGIGRHKEAVANPGR